VFRYYSLGGGTDMPGRLYARLCHAFLVTISLPTPEVSMVISCVCDFVCLCAHALKEKRLKLSTPNMVNITVQRSRSDCIDP